MGDELGCGSSTEFPLQQRRGDSYLTDDIPLYLDVARGTRIGPQGLSSPFVITTAVMAMATEKTATVMPIFCPLVSLSLYTPVN